jgi:hypothetical protein
MAACEAAMTGALRQPSPRCALPAAYSSAAITSSVVVTSATLRIA